MDTASLGSAFGSVISTAQDMAYVLASWLVTTKVL